MFNSQLPAHSRALPSSSARVTPATLPVPMPLLFPCSTLSGAFKFIVRLRFRLCRGPGPLCCRLRRTVPLNFILALCDYLIFLFEVSRIANASYYITVIDQFAKARRGRI
ncbi:hypothetical protein C8R45DRAFT_1022502, partial [Mycena sanguinolenta]